MTQRNLERPARQPRKGVISFGSGLRLVSIPYVAEIMGLTSNGARAFVAALDIPCLQVGHIWWCDLHRFMLVLKMQMSIGQPDFLAPGCEQLKKGRRKGYREQVTKADTKLLRGDLSPVIAEIIYSRKLMQTFKTEGHVKEFARRAAQRIIEHQIRIDPMDAQTKFQKAALRKLQNAT